MESLTVGDEVRFRTSPDPNHPDNRTMESFGWTKHPASRSHETEGRLQAMINKQGQIELDLSNQNLRTIPREVFNQLRTESLKLHSNDLRALPPAISKLHKLRVLDIHGNNVSSLPDTLINLLHLQEIDLSNNKLAAVPSLLGSFKYLKVLRLADNHFESLPHELGELSALREFALQGNKLWHLPYSLEKLQHLKQLNLARNRFDQCPICLCHLKSLQTLDLHGNKLTNLPADMDRLKMLQELNLASNDFESIPQCVYNLRGLQSLDVSHNKLRALPSRVGRLPKLRILNVDDNNISSVPSNLETLEYLNVGNNKVKNFSVVKMKRLVYLNASHNVLENMPLGIYNLTHLKVLKLNSNFISYISQDVVLLKKLRTLDLGNNQLLSLPQVINELDKLEVFNVKGNKIEARYPYSVHYRGPPVQMVPVGLVKVRPRPRREVAREAAQNGHIPSPSPVRAKPPLPNMTQIQSQPDPSGTIRTRTSLANGKIHTIAGEPSSYEHGRSTYAKNQAPLQPKRMNRFAKFRKSLGLGRKSKTKSEESGTVEIRADQPRKQSGVQYSEASLFNSPKTISQDPTSGYEIATVDQPQYRSLPRGLDSMPNTERRSTLIGNDIPLNSNPRSLSEITYPFDSTIHGELGAMKRAYTDDWVTSRQLEDDSVKSTAVTINDSVGDQLSLGEEDYEYQPTTVTDYRLLGVCSEVETMLNQQLLHPIISHKGIFQKSLLNGHGTLRTLYSMPNISDFNDLSNLSPSHRATLGSIDNESDEVNRAPPGGIYRAKPDVFRVTPAGGLFRSSVDANVSVYFPKNALDLPITITMQIEMISPETLAEARKIIPELENLIAAGHVVYFTQNKDMDFNSQVMLTIPAPPVEHTGRLHLLTYLDDDVCVPCTSAYRQHQGYISLQTWHFSGKGAVLTKSKSKYKACKSMELFLRHLYV